ncbi:hypothetical protein AB0I81_60025 [Nonomuraea sp. NPDC050404]|uniref:hypothetical protein n=1 Tax=Nonomuraea sp. NPDC050404 TaxID=3155783 RepID=UPI003403E58B
MSEADKPHSTSESDGLRTAQEPRLRIRDVDRPRSRVPIHVIVALPLALIGLIALLATGNALRPFESITVIEARMGSKSDYFEDPEVQRLLLKHGLVVVIRRLGSRSIAMQSLEGLDVVFPSGQPASELIRQLIRKRQGPPPNSMSPFVTPLVLGTFRAYAETLVERGVATRQPAESGGETLYYDLDMQKFIQLLDNLPDSYSYGRAEGADTWNGLGFDKHPGRSNSGRVMVRTSSVCESNSAATYLSILAFVANGNKPPGAGKASKAEEMREAGQVAEKIKPLINIQGLEAAEQDEGYFSHDGENMAPIVLKYEHQYLAYQIEYEQKRHRPDTNRVLLYPTPHALTEPQLISLSSKGDRLVDLVKKDSELRQRAIELGFRVSFSEEDGTSNPLNNYMRKQGIQVPNPNHDEIKVSEPNLDVLEQMIKSVGSCEAAGQDAE